MRGRLMQAPASRTSAVVAVASNANTAVRTASAFISAVTSIGTQPHRQKCAPMLRSRRISRHASKSNATALVGNNVTFAMRMLPASPSAVPSTMPVCSQRYARWSSLTLTPVLACLVPKRSPACGRLMQALALTRNALGALESNASFVSKKQQQCTGAAKTIGILRLPRRCVRTLSWTHAWTSSATDVGESSASFAARMPPTSRRAAASTRQQAHPASARPVQSKPLCRENLRVQRFWNGLGQSIDAAQLIHAQDRL